MIRSLLSIAMSLWSLGIGQAPAAVNYYSLEGRPIPVFVQGEGPDTVLFLGTQHGNEPQGSELVKRLLQEILRRPALLVGHRIVSMPTVNPDGLFRHTRTNARGVDLNRNFPTLDWHLSDLDEYFSGLSPSSEPETRAIEQVIAGYQPARI